MHSVLEFWFQTLEPSDWFKKSEDLDIRIKEQFEHSYRKIVAGETSSWRESAEGRLAEIIVLDQFSRNMYRGLPQAFIYDPLALALSQEAVRGGYDAKLPAAQQTFLYMPFMHSESARVHVQAMELFKDLPNLDYEIKHKAVIDQFGRYPHRNKVLGRSSTEAELEWMKDNRGF